ncbi:MAG: L-seryl-tRNA(Sec) selenium transferase [Acidobacteria bacterium]|nr:L-seryl-tRNA(Sec) selenium transferase [Acidobacteriota bacterium]
MSGSLRELPSVDQVLARLGDAAAAYPRGLVVDEVRRALEAMRAEIRAGRAGGAPAEERALRSLQALARPSLRPVINATGVVLHTNLGRAPLGRMSFLAGYSNLEYDLAAGRRGRRDVHAGALCERLLGAPRGVGINNAAAVYLALHELAGGHEAIVSRGELIEIGDGFRIPDIMLHSGAVLREVGSTNRTHIGDYRAAFSERTRLILRVHRSNFRMAGFTARPELKELAALARERGVPLYEDLGSGCLADLQPFGIDEPLARASLAAGADLVSFSGDKLLGGPQAGILAGRAELIARLRRNPMCRALRAGKLICQALEETLRRLMLERWEEIPALAMIRADAEEIRERGEAFAGRRAGLDAEVIPGESVIGGGATPEQRIPTWLVALRAAKVSEFEQRLRQGEPPVVARVENGRLLVDLRTVFPEEEAALAAAILQARV